MVEQDVSRVFNAGPVVMVVMVVLVAVAVLYGMTVALWFSVGTRDAAGILVR